MSAEPATLLSRALDPGVEPPSDPLSERVLDAALALAAASGTRHLTIDDVARRARVGRMTVYRRFGDKAGLLEALAVRESRRCLSELDAAVAADAPIAEQIVEGFVASMRLAREHPLLNRLARFEPEAVLEALSANGGRLFSAMCGFAAARLGASGQAGALPVAVDEAAELLVRLCISFVLVQHGTLATGDDESARGLARRLVAPLLREAGAGRHAPSAADGSHLDRPDRAIGDGGKSRLDRGLR